MGDLNKNAKCIISNDDSFDEFIQIEINLLQGELLSAKSAKRQAPNKQYFLLYDSISAIDLPFLSILIE